MGARLVARGLEQGRRRLSAGLGACGRAEAPEKSPGGGGGSRLNGTDIYWERGTAAFPAADEKQRAAHALLSHSVEKRTCRLYIYINIYIYIYIYVTVF